MRYKIIIQPEAASDLQRLAKIYRIFETEVYVDVLAAYGHYDDK